MKAECNIPVRMFIGVDNATKILHNCSRHKVLYAAGFLGIITLFLLGAYVLTRSSPEGTFKVPIWLVLMPTLFLIIYATTVASRMQQSFISERIEQQLSGMSKKDYINYKIGDDRGDKSLAGAAQSAGTLAGSNILGPFLRGDTR